MSRALLIGGFGASEEMLEPLGETLSRRYEEIDILTLRQGRNDPDRVRKMALDAEVVALSAAHGLLENTRPSALHALDPILNRSSVRTLGMQGLVKELRLHGRDHREALEFEIASAREIIPHSLFYAGELRRVAKLDGAGIDVHLRSKGTDVNVAVLDESAFVQLYPGTKARLDQGDVTTVRLPGQHDDPLLRPEATINNYYAAIA